MAARKCEQKKRQEQLVRVNAKLRYPSSVIMWGELQEYVQRCRDLWNVKKRRAKQLNSALNTIVLSVYKPYLTKKQVHIARII